MDNTDILSALDSIDLSSVETAMPILPAGLYQARVATMTADQNKAGTGHILNIKLQLTQPQQDGKGNPTNPNFPLFDRISLVATEKYDPKPALARFMEGTLGHKNGKFMPLEQYIGQEVTVKVAIEDDAQYGRKNVVKGYIKKG